jgi:hypothetical protein
VGVLQFGRKRAEEPKEQHGCGDAFCMSCGHEWVGVAPTGSTFFECGQCHRWTGHWKFGFYPPTDTKVWQCNCGNQLFYMTPEGHLCASCGIYQRY